MGRPAGAAAGTAADSANTQRVAASVQRLAHVLSRARAQLLDRAHHDVEWSAQVLVQTLLAQGPMRSSALADAMQADPSTVSRQVAALVRDGIVVREPDPVDGRASVLRATGKARRMAADHAAIRDQHVARILAAWSERDKARLGDLLDRFTTDLQAYKTRVGARGWTEAPGQTSDEDPLGTS